MPIFGHPAVEDTVLEPPLLADPDCFRIGDIYYAFSAAADVQLCKSIDLANWMYVKEEL